MICSSLNLLFLIVLLPFFSQQNSPFVTSSFSGSGQIPYLIGGPHWWGLAGSITGLSLLVAGFWPSEFKEPKS
jgi:hypothetical protein